jgi:hypothetical protein
MPKKGKKTGTQKKDLIAKGLATKANRKSLAESMVEPIRRALEYGPAISNLLYIKEMSKKR